MVQVPKELQYTFLGTEQQAKVAGWHFAGEFGQLDNPGRVLAWVDFAAVLHCNFRMVIRGLPAQFEYLRNDSRWYNAFQRLNITSAFYYVKSNDKGNIARVDKLFAVAARVSNCKFWGAERTDWRVHSWSCTQVFACLDWVAGSCTNNYFRSSQSETATLAHF